MKSIPYHRFLVAAFLLSIFTPSLGRSQDFEQMDSMYAAVQRFILQTYPTALFPPMPYDHYEIEKEEPHRDGSVDITVSLSDDFPGDCPFMFPEFYASDVAPEDVETDPTVEMSLLVSFYLAHPEKGTLQEGRADLTVVRKRKTDPSLPNEYMVREPDESDETDESGIAEPQSTESFQCGAYLKCVPAEHPLHALIKKHCPKY